MPKTRTNINTQPTTHNNQHRKDNTMQNTLTQEQLNTTMEQQLKQAQTTAQVTQQPVEEVIKDTIQDTKEGIITSLTSTMKDIYHYSKDKALAILTWMYNHLDILVTAVAYGVGIVISGALWYGLFCILGIV